MERSSEQVVSTRGVRRGPRAVAVAVALACVVLYAPGRASAADFVGIEGLVGGIQAEVYTELAAAVPQPAAAGFLRDAQPGRTLLATNDAASPPDAIGPGSPPGAVFPFVVPAPTAAWAQAPSTAGPGVLHVAPRSVRRSSQRTNVRTRVALAVTASVRNGTAVTVAHASVRQRVQAESGASARARPPGAGAPDRRSSAPNRQPPPPAPGPGPDMSSAAQGGGQGLLLPLVLAALAAVLALFGFALLPRVLPLPAFRKPRRIVHPPWHPG